MEFYVLGSKQIDLSPVTSVLLFSFYCFLCEWVCTCVFFYSYVLLYRDFMLPKCMYCNLVKIDSIIFVLNRIFEFLGPVIVPFLLQPVYFFFSFLKFLQTVCNCNLISALGFCQGNVCKSTGHACCKAT